MNLHRRLLAIMGVCLLITAAGKTQAEPPSISTSRSSFTLPFRYDQAELKRLKASQVQLFVSQDRGKTWQLDQKAGIDITEFTFVPKTDGEFWFSVAVLAGDGTRHPEPGVDSTGLIVHVDREIPQLELNLAEQATGRVKLSWQTTDENIDINSLELEYRNSPQENWKKVYIKPLLQGQTSWKSNPSQQPEVRGRITDKAGNVAESVVQLNKMQQRSGKPGMIVSASSAPQQKPTVETVRQTSATDQAMLPEIHPSPASPDIPAKKLLLEPLNSPQLVKSPPLQPAPQKRLKSMTEPVKYSPAVNSARSSHVRYMNSKEFQIDYQVTGTGPSGVGVVELYVTEDGGQRWWRYGVDADLKSPMNVKVPADGHYGFHFRIHSGVGNAEIPPQSGQKPQIHVVVDSTPPDLKLLKAYQGHGAEIGQVSVQWEFRDAYPGEKPITLFQSGHPEGPWQQVLPALANDGSLTFALPQNVSTRLYLKLVGTDASGNTTAAKTEEPILIDLSRPSARVIMIDAIR